MEEFLNILAAPVENGGMNLRFVSSKIKEHYANENERFKKYTGVRLIGAQAISCARYSLHIIDDIKDESNNDYQKIKLLAL